MRLITSMLNRELKPSYCDSKRLVLGPFKSHYYLEHLKTRLLLPSHIVLADSGPPYNDICKQLVRGVVPDCRSDSILRHRLNANNN